MGLILGLGGLGLGGLAWLSVSSLENQVVSLREQNTWYRYNGTNFVCNPANTYLTFSGLLVEFELGPNESVYLSFTARAHTEQIPGWWSRISVYFTVDGSFEWDPSAQVGTYDGAFMINFMLHLEYIKHDLSPGEHNVTVIIYGDSSGNYIHESMLIVQKIQI